MPKVKVKLSGFRCALCGRKLPIEEYVYSRFTGNRYCLEGKCKPRPKESE
jgi:hypothetical protein